MRSIKIKFAASCFLALIACVATAISIDMFNHRSAFANVQDYGQSYRNQLAYSAREGWNNDPNGLLYVNGTYHMYYQYTWNEHTNSTALGWNDMSWGHATSNDLVNWTEQPVAIPAYQTVDGTFYAMMFSGSAVYDERNTSGLFDVDSNGKVVEGQGIVAILTQPDDSVGGQRQILAFSKDDGQSFTIEGEVLSANDDGGLNDGEFRDPKVFWSEKHEKWLMAVGGGSVRMYSSENLLDWTYLGETGYWGECPDITAYSVDGVDKYVLIISPEDKVNSHKYNGTNRETTYYPAEYYVVGDLTEEGLFKSTQELRQLSCGVDSYAFQSFNNVPDGKVYGISWSASWKTVGGYERLREVYNGGLGIACELNLVKGENGYDLLRTPVNGFENLRSKEIFSFSGNVEAGKNALSNLESDMADIELNLDFSTSKATEAKLKLRSSAAEYVALNYDLKSQTLTLDRSKSSLIAKDTFFYEVPFSAKVPLIGGKLSLRIILDRAFISVFANDGVASIFAAIFPSAISNSFSLISDGKINLDAHIYAVESIFGTQNYSNKLLMQTDDLQTNTGVITPIIASSFSNEFESGAVVYSIVEGGENISLQSYGGIAYLTALKSGMAKIKAEYSGQILERTVWINDNGFKSDVAFDTKWLGFSCIRSDGYLLSGGTADTFRFSNKTATDFRYSAEIKPENSDSQAAGLVFGVSDNLMGYYVANIDLKENVVKLWKAGEGDIKTASYQFDATDTIKLTVSVNSGTVKIYVNDGVAAVITQYIDGFTGGKVGINSFNASMIFNNIKLVKQSGEINGFNLGEEVLKSIVNIDDDYKLTADDFEIDNGIITLAESYIKTLSANGEHTFRVTTNLTDYNLNLKTDFVGVSVMPLKDDYIYNDILNLALSADTQVLKVLIDGESCPFTLDGRNILLGNDVVRTLALGEHDITVYTTNGRPTGVIKISDDGTQNIVSSVEETEKANHLFLYIDLAIFGALIAAYVAFTVYKKFKAKK